MAPDGGPDARQHDPGVAIRVSPCRGRSRAGLTVAAGEFDGWDVGLARRRHFGGEDGPAGSCVRTDATASVRGMTRPAADH